jgi:hypothetical protein
MVIKCALKGSHELHRCAFDEVTGVPSLREQFGVVARLIIFVPRLEVIDLWMTKQFFQEEQIRHVLMGIAEAALRK